MERRIYIGTYTEGTNSKGIYALSFDGGGGTLEEIATIQSDNPSFLAKRGNILYAANEQKGTGKVSSFFVHPDSSLTFKNSVDFSGSATCHVAVSIDGRFLFAANYLSGNAASFPIFPDGSLGDAVSVVQHEGKGANPKRQESPHAHSVNPTPDGKRLVVADLGIDRLMIYDIDQESGALSLNKTQPFVKMIPGEGPRHMAVGADGKNLYVVTELGNHVIHYVSAADDSLIERHMLPILPLGFRGDSIAADIHLSPDGRFLYASSRGWDGVTSYAVDSDGSIEPLEFVQLNGKTPRNFALSPDERFLLVGYQDSDRIAVYSRDIESGKIEKIVSEYVIPSPVCLLFE